MLPAMSTRQKKNGTPGASAALERREAVAGLLEAGAEALGAADRCRGARRARRGAERRVGHQQRARRVIGTGPTNSNWREAGAVEPRALRSPPRSRPERQRRELVGELESVGSRRAGRDRRRRWPISRIVSAQAAASKSSSSETDSASCEVAARARRSRARPRACRSCRRAPRPRGRADRRSCRQVEPVAHFLPRQPRAAAVVRGERLVDHLQPLAAMRR